MTTKQNFTCDRCRHKVQLPSNASYDERKCSKCGARYQRDDADTDLQGKNHHSYVKTRRNVVFILLIIIALGGGTVYVVMHSDGDEWMAHLKLGNDYLKSGDYDNAIAELNNLITTNPQQRK